jgi:hypothetical protein
MVKISKQELRELATVLVVANTPNSLYEGLVDCSATKKLIKQMDQADSLSYYDKITSRAKRNEIVIALAYAVLISILRNKNGLIQPDVSRLDWGAEILEFEKSADRKPAIFTFDATPKHSIGISTSIASTKIITIGK